MTMEYRRLGKSGLRLSALSFGSWVTFSNQLDDKKAGRLMAMAYEAGVNFFDNAEVYANGESERIMGKILKDLSWGRDSFCVSSKVFWGGPLPTQRGLSRKHVVDACHAALKRLQVDYLDLYFCHRPDTTTPIEETVRAMHDLIQQGKVLYWGTSEWNAAQIMEAHRVAAEWRLTPPTMEQPQYNLFHRQKVEGDFHDLYQSIGLGTTIWSPLASGILTGKYRHGLESAKNPEGRAFVKGLEWFRASLETEEGKEKIKKANELEKLAHDLGFTLAQMSIAWCLKNQNVSSVILGASQEKQLQENLESLQVTSKLTKEIMERIESIVNNKPALSPNYLEW